MFVKIFITRVLSAHPSKLNYNKSGISFNNFIFSSPIKYNNSIRELHRKSIYKREEAKKIRFYIVHKYVEYLKNYDKTLEKAFPKFTSVYRVFTEGVKEFIIDVKNYFRIVHFLYTPGNNLKKLTRKEIELYQKIPKDMRKVAPTLIISSLPFAFYVVLPMIYFFPKQLLTDHFWNLQQRSDFTIQYLRARLLHNKPIFRYLQLQLDNLKGHKLYEPWNAILGMLGSGLQPTPEQILECKDLFSAEPYHLLYLSHLHVRHLLKVHELHVGWFRRTRLADKAVILIAMDKAIMREGGVHNLPLEALKTACLIRGLNPINMKSEDMIIWLQNWIKISNEIDKHSLSLLLHCPILLGYNEPSNWMLIYSKK